MELDYPVVFFDGICNFCNATVNFVIKNDRKALFKFSSLQSEFGQFFLRENSLPPASFETIYLIKDGKIYERSDAIVEIGKHLNWVWPLAYILSIVPLRIRNAGYDFVARNRYRLFKKANTCRIPSPEEYNRFIY